MHVYSCWYQSNFGYSCRAHTEKWMFVPELGQPDNKIYKNLLLEDLTFKYAREKSFEEMQEHRPLHSTLLSVLHSILFPRAKPRTMAGLLLTTF